ncbi:MAG TPA: hypothetical protein VF503_33650 [Sphingobium sp.]|uniref:hypothetical protein n=1 Tax=Sphingobium sp. TaxID=1912891 RepID=UPI002ED3514E
MSKDEQAPRQRTVACMGEMLLRLSGPRDGRLFDSSALLALTATKHFTFEDASTSTPADVAAFRQGQFDVRR